MNWRRSLVVVGSVVLVVQAAVVVGSPAGAASEKEPPPPKVRVDKVRAFKAKHGQAEAKRAREEFVEQRRQGKAALAAQRVANAAEPSSPAPSASSGSSLISPLAAAAVEVGEKSGGGDYAATPLSASADWSAGGSSGSFEWSYPIEVPAPAAGPAPSLKIGYSSGSVDGRIPTANNQTSVVGEGFDLSSSYIERSYLPCSEEGQEGKGDLCWRGNAVTLVLNGRSTQLVHDESAEGNGWRLKGDDGSKVQRLTGGDNEANDGEHWRVTTSDGTQYTFGLNKLPGASASVRTESTWTVPVYGDDTGEPCHGDTFAESSCRQAWRWNLDYVLDVDGNASTYWYAKETNRYAKNGNESSDMLYVRGGFLQRIDYGLREGALFSQAPHQVVFSTKERCLQASGCEPGDLTSSTKNSWPDVPYSSICTGTAECTDDRSPTFFTRKRLTGIVTQTWNAGAYQKVSSWTISHDFRDMGEVMGTGDQILVPTQIQRSGEAGTVLVTSPVKFTYLTLMNRVNPGTDRVIAGYRPRIHTITSETGAVTTVEYSARDCAVDDLPGSQETNSRRCFPVRWTLGSVDPVVDWFHKYVVTGVSVSEPTGGAQTMETSFAYSGGAGWGKDETPVTPKAARTWSSWRGYGKVTTQKGATTNPVRSKTVDVYMRGLAGETVAGVDAPDLADKAHYAGFHRESVTYDGADKVSGTVNTPWSALTATQDFPSDVVARAHMVRTGATQQRRYTAAGVQTRTQTTTFDSYGMATSVNDAGNDAATGDESCTRTWYARNPAIGLVALTSRVQTVAVGCSQTANLPQDADAAKDLISDTATGFDGAASWSGSQTPTHGRATWTGRAASYNGSTPVWQRVSTNTFDTLGRVLDTTDAAGATTSTSYTPTGGGPVTSVAVTNALQHKTVTTFDPVVGKPVKITDPNNKLTEFTYDALGRTTQVWTPISSRALGRAATYKFAYSLSASAPSWVSTSTYQGNTYNYNTSFEIYDSLLRPLQTQVPGPPPTGGRIIAETLYDDRGLAYQERTDIHATGAPSGTRVGTIGGQSPAQTNTTYDGAERPTVSQFMSFGVSRWQSVTGYTGDSVATTPPAGGSAQRVYTDMRGNTVKRVEYEGGTPTGTGLTTTYTLDPAGRMTAMRGPDNAAWTWAFDPRGRMRTSNDPDKGVTTTTYDNLDQALTTTDARNTTLAYAYDTLGRKIGRWAGEKTDANLLAAWTYDPNGAKGQPAASTRYVGGKAGKAYTKTITGYDAAYRPTGAQLAIPTDDHLVTTGAVPSTGKVSQAFGYNLDGTQQFASEPAMGSLAAEVLTTTYNTIGNPIGLAGSNGYVVGAAWSPEGDLQQAELATSASSTTKVFLTNIYEDGTRRLLQSDITQMGRTWTPLQLNYRYNDAGLVTAISDRSTDVAGGAKRDYQCFAYDGYQRLTEAWTPQHGTELTSPQCAVTRSVSGLGGAAPYWNSYTYNNAGLRTAVTDHTPTGDQTDTYTHGGANEPPHAVTKVADATTTRSYTYDDAGNTLSRPGPNGSTQNLFWDSENELIATAENADTRTEYLYDADGELLIRRNSTATTNESVLYAGGTEAKTTTTAGVNTVSGTRTYRFGNVVVAVRHKSGTTNKLRFVAGDAHSTMSVAIDPAGGTVQKRYMAPFGATRAVTANGWDDDKGFLNKVDDQVAGLTHIGARAYDTDLGQFISIDPLLDTADPQSINGYAYAGNSPISIADPSGLDPINEACRGSNMVECNNQSYSGVTNSGNNGDPNLNTEVAAAHGWNRELTYADSNVHLPVATTPVRYEKRIPAPTIRPVLQVTGIPSAVRCAQGDGAGSCVGAVIGLAATACTAAAVASTAGTGAGACAAGGKALMGRLGMGGAKGVPALRQAYVDEVGGLATREAKMRSAGASDEAIARALHADRRALGVKYKDLTPGAERARIYARNVEKYGDELGPSIEYLINRGKSWEDIIDSAKRTGGHDLGY